jgi:phospholipid/cholesterol/gamma-HCH transport system permease protein
MSNLQEQSSTPKNKIVVLRPTGALDVSSVPSIRQHVFDDLAAAGCEGVAVDASGITRIDGAGLGLLAELRRFALERFHQELTVTGLRPDLQHLIQVASLQDPTAKQLAIRKPDHAVQRLGAQVAAFGEDARGLITFVGEFLAAFWTVARSPRQFRWREFFSIAQEVGADAVVILSLLGFLLGAILAFQTAVPLDRFGAVQLIPTIVGIAMLRELGPLIAAILVAGRTGAAFAAELGTMRVTEELSALRVMGLDPMAFLVVPRVLATLLMLPLLCIYTDVMGVLGGFSVMMSRGFSFVQYVESVRSNIEAMDAVGGVVKTFAFAMLIAFAGCERGMTTGPGPGAVGRSTTKAVVSSIVLIIAADVIVGFIYYALGV